MCTTTIPTTIFQTQFEIVHRWRLICKQIVQKYIFNIINQDSDLAVDPNCVEGEIKEDDSDLPIEFS